MHISRAKAGHWAIHKGWGVARTPLWEPRKRGMRSLRLTYIILATLELASCGADAPSAVPPGSGTRAGAAADSLPHPLVITQDELQPPESESVSTGAAGPVALEARPPSSNPGVLLARAAERRTRRPVTYDPAYVRIPYPMGDVPDDRGVCADVIVRAYRKLGVDLQREVHEDMARAFPAYPRIWGLSRPDRNIDHRRVPNLETYLARRGAELPLSDDPADYQPGDLVTYRLDGRLPHIAIVAEPRNAQGRPLIVHNIGAGERIEDALFDWPMHRRFRWPAPQTEAVTP